MVGGVADYLHGIMAASLDVIRWSLWSAERASYQFDAQLPYAVNRFAIQPRLLGQRRGDRIPPWRKLNTWLWRNRKRQEGRSIVQRIVAADKPDAIVIGRWCEDAHGWCIACRKLNIPYILMTYGMELLKPVPRPAGPALADDLVGARIVFGCGCDTIRLVNEMTHGAVKTAVVHPGIFPERLQPLPDGDRSSVLAKMNLQGRAFILSMGRLVHRKGFDLAVRAFAEVAEDYPEVDLVIAGDGEARSEIETAVARSGIPGRIRLTGEVTDLQKRVLLQDCTFFMMANRPVPDDMEGFGIVFLEANFFGKAVLGGNNGGVPDAIIHGETGLLVDSPDLTSISSAMRKLLGDRAFRNTCGERGRARVSRDFQWPQLVKGFVSTLCQVL